MKNKLWFIPLAIISLVFSGCAQQSQTSKNVGATSQEDSKIKINTTIFPLQEFASKIGGKYATVKNVVPPGVEPHDYEPTIQSMSQLSESDLFIYNGAGLEGFVDKALDTIDKEKTIVVEASDGIKLEEGADEHTAEEQKDKHSHHEPHNHADLDPHVFIDPIHSIKMAENIKNALVKKDPTHRNYYQKNFENLKEQLVSLDQKFTALMKHNHKKEILVSHAAYGYWEKRYGLRQIPIAGLSPSNEPTQKQLQTIIELSKRHHIHFVLYEDNIKPRVADTVKAEVGAEALSFHNMESPSLKDIENNEDYISLMEKNIKLLKKVLK